MNDRQLAEVMAAGAKAALNMPLVNVESAQQAVDVYNRYLTSPTISFTRRGRWYVVIVRAYHRELNSPLGMVFVTQADPRLMWMPKRVTEV